MVVVSNIQLWLHSDVTYLSRLKVISQAGVCLYLRGNTQDFKSKTKIEYLLRSNNGLIHVLSTMMSNIITSANESEIKVL